MGHAHAGFRDTLPEHKVQLVHLRFLVSKLPFPIT